MIKAIIFDFCRVFLFPKDQGYFGELNSLHQALSENPNYNFLDNFEFNQELMDFIKNEEIDLNFKLYLFTSGTIQNTLECQKFIGNIFRNSFSALEMKMKKNKPSSYLLLAEKISLEPHDILFVDDSRENTCAAETAGYCTITFRNNMQFETEIGGYLSKFN